jgi:predicted metal-dependent hydrolase
MVKLLDKHEEVFMFPQYIHIIKKNLKHTYLSFNDEGVLLIKSPQISQKQLEHILLKKASWITSSQKKLANKKGGKLDFIHKSILYFLGKAYPIHTVKHDKKITKLIFHGDSFTLYYHTWDETLFQSHIHMFYKNQIMQYLPQQIYKWEKIMHVQSKKINFRKTKRQWGSCSKHNHLSFNTMLMKLPPDVIEYIIVHELAHITFKHHQKDFWEYVEKFLPDYRLHIQELHNYIP